MSVHRVKSKETGRNSGSLILEPVKSKETGRNSGSLILEPASVFKAHVLCQDIYCDFVIRLWSYSLFRAQDSLRRRSILLCRLSFSLFRAQDSLRRRYILLCRLSFSLFRAQDSLRRRSILLCRQSFSNTLFLGSVMWPSGPCPLILASCHVHMFNFISVRFKVRVAVAMKIAVFLRVTPWRMADATDILEATAASVIRVALHIYHTTRRHPRRREY